jgi:hypothetical protein
MEWQGRAGQGKEWKNQQPSLKECACPLLKHTEKTIRTNIRHGLSLSASQSVIPRHRRTRQPNNPDSEMEANELLTYGQMLKPGIPWETLLLGLLLVLLLFKS